MKKEHLLLFVFLVMILTLYHPIEGKKVTIHVPYRIKKIKHTHTVYKVIPHIEHGRSDEVEEEFDHFKK